MAKAVEDYIISGEKDVLCSSHQCINLILNAISEFPLSLLLNFIGFVNLISASYRRVWNCSPFGAPVINWSSSDNREVDWLDLPDHVVAVIADRLISQKDLIRFGAVCQSWRSIYTEVNYRRKPRLPLLMLATEHNQDEKTRSFYSLTEKRVCNTQVPVPADRFICGSSHGWLVTVSPNFQVSLLDPFNSNEIQLPPLQAFEEEAYGHEFDVWFIDKAILSTSPTTDPNYVVLVIYGARNALAFYKPGNKTWISIEKQIFQFIDAIYYRDQFYALTQFGDVYVCDLNRPEVPKLVKLGVPPAMGDNFISEKDYLVESSSSGELLHVVRLFKKWYVKGARDADGDRIRNYSTDGFDVFKLDSEKGEWIELQNLDGRVLFVGDNDSVCLLASDYPELKPNSIYFTDDSHTGYVLQHAYGIGNHDMGIFCFDDLTKTHQHYPLNSNMIFPAPIWVEPQQALTPC